MHLVGTTVSVTLYFHDSESVLYHWISTLTLTIHYFISLSFYVSANIFIVEGQNANALHANVLNANIAAIPPNNIGLVHVVVGDSDSSVSSECKEYSAASQSDSVSESDMESLNGDDVAVLQMTGSNNVGVVC